MWPLHLLNQLRLPFVLDRCEQAFEDLTSVSFLDIGCGGGLLSESIAQHGSKVVGIDAAEKNIRIGSAHQAGADLDLQYVHTTLETWTDPRQFDVVLNMEVVEHVENLQWFMEMACNRVRPGGLMFIATINRTVFSALTAKFAAEYVLKLLPIGTHQWRKFVKPQELTELVHYFGLDTENPLGVSVNPFSRQMKISPFTGANYMLVAKKR